MAVKRRNFISFTTKFSGSVCVMGPEFRLVGNISLRHVELVGQVVIIC